MTRTNGTDVTMMFVESRAPSSARQLAIAVEPGRPTRGQRDFLSTGSWPLLAHNHPRVRIFILREISNNPTGTSRDKVVPRAGVEPATSPLGGARSIQLSYRGNDSHRGPGAEKAAPAHHVPQCCGTGRSLASQRRWRPAALPCVPRGLADKLSSCLRDAGSVARSTPLLRS